MASASSSSILRTVVKGCCKTRYPCPPARAASSKAPPVVALEYNKLGSSDLMVSEICMGTMVFGNQTSEKDALKMMDYAWDCGVNFLDTAELYPVPPKRETQGMCSTIVGNWMKTRKRDEVIVATKVAGHSKITVWVPRNRTVPEGEEGTVIVNAKAIFEACEGELRRLQTDYLDLLQIHWPDRYVPLFGKNQYRIEEERDFVPFDEQVQAMGDLIKAGKIRHWGLSNESPYGTIMMCTAADRLNVPRPVSIQNSFSLVGRSFESDLAEVCSPTFYNLGLIPWSPAAGGALSGKYLDGKRPKGSRYEEMYDRYPRYHSRRVETAVKEYVNIAKEAGLTPIELAYLFCKSRWFIPSTIIGASNEQQLEENIGAFGKKLSEETLKRIDETHLLYTNPQNMD